MDGVLWRDQQPLGDLPSIFAEFSKRGLKIILATNNATLSADQYVEKLKRFGVIIEQSQVVNSSQATARYLKRLHPAGGTVFVLVKRG